MKINVLIAVCLFGITLSLQAKELPKLRVNLSGGFAYMLSTDPEGGLVEDIIRNDAFKKMEKQEKWAINFDGNIHYLFDSGLGVGAKYRYMLIDVSPTDLLVDAGQEHYRVISLSGKDKIVYVAPSLLYARWLDPQARLLGSAALSVGYSWLESQMEMEGYVFRAHGGNVAFQVDLGVDYFLTSSVSLGVGTGLFYSKLNNLKINTIGGEVKLPEKEQVNLSNIKLNLSLSYYF